MIQIMSVDVVEDRRLRLGLSDGSWVERDVTGLLYGPVFEDIRASDAAFARARIRRGTVAWPRDVDLDPDVLIWGGAAPEDPGAVPPPRMAIGYDPVRGPFPIG